jgi:alpha-mannosidase
VRIEPRMYWRPDSIRFTVDGNEPTIDSAVFAAPFILAQTTIIRTAVFDEHGHRGPVTTSKVQVQDDTPPTVVSAKLSYGAAIVHVAFSEPVDDTARDVRSYAFDPKIAVTSVAPGADSSEVVLALAAEPEAGRVYKLSIVNVKDGSPAHNAIQPVSLDLSVKGPVFEMKTVAKADMGKEIKDVLGLPIKADDAWTINLWARADKTPQNRTLIAGFGKCAQGVDGGARYLAKWQSGLHFWSDNRDAASRAPFEVGPWQMITATYDGHVLKLYKDGKQVGAHETLLADDQNVVSIAPLDPWEKERRFAGEIRNFAIWDQALGPESLMALATVDREGGSEALAPTHAGSKGEKPPR